MPRLTMNQAPTTAVTDALEARLDTVEANDATQDSSISTLDSTVGGHTTTIGQIESRESKVGRPIYINATDVTGGGTDASLNITLGITPTTSDKYKVNGVAIVRKQGDDAVICTVTYSDAVFLRDSGSSWAAVAGGQVRLSEKHADFASYFSSDNNVPILGDNSNNLALFFNGVSSSLFSIEFDGDIANLGA